MSWSQMFRRGAAMVADRRTYVILLIGVLAGCLIPGLLEFLAARSSNLGLSIAVAILSVVWGWLVATFTLAALSIAATERVGGRSASPVIRAAMAQLGAFLCVTLILGGIWLLGLLGLGLLALIGLGGSTTAPILAVLSPAFLVWGLVLLAIGTTGRLAFASLACEPGSPGRAVRRAWDLCRTRTSDVVLWVVGDTAIQVGVSLGIVGPALFGAASAASVEGAFLGAGVVSDFLNGTGNSGAAKVGVVIWLIVVLTFALVVLGAQASFSLGSAVGFYEAVGSVQRAGPAPGRGASAMFCDQCGAPRLDSSPYCDLCGAARVLV